MTGRLPLVAAVALVVSSACGGGQTDESDLTAAGPGTAPPPPPAAPIDLELPRLDGGSWHLSDERGQVVVLHFFATFDGPSQSVATTLEQVHITLAPEAVSIVGVAMDPETTRRGRAELVEAYCALNNLTFEVLLSNAALTEERTDVGRVPAIPATVVIDRHGRPVASFTGTFRRDELESLIRDVLAGRR